MRSHGMLQRQLALATALAITAHAAMAAPAASSQPWQCNRTIKSPIIGVVALPTDGKCVTAAADLEAAMSEGASVLQPGQLDPSCFGDVYVKWLEAAGARVAPIRYNAPKAELTRLLRSVNGLLFTGGEVYLWANQSAPAADREAAHAGGHAHMRTPAEPHSAAFMHAARFMFDWAVKANAGGDYFPVWGTCMGMQLLSVLAARDASVLLDDAYDSDGISLALELAQPAADNSRLLGKASSAAAREAIAIASSLNVTVNLHEDGVPPSAFERSAALGEFFEVLSTNVDKKGKRFVSTIEGKGKQRPFWGAQWHPERPQFEFDFEAPERVAHSMQATQAMQYFANFFVRQAYGSAHCFATEEAEQASLIYNYATSSGRGTSYQCYSFS